MKIGYKGFDKNLMCRTTQYILGETYTKAYVSDSHTPRLCTEDGYHYCESLKDVFQFYGKQSGNRFCIVEVLGAFASDSTKSVTTSFRIICEITEILEDPTALASLHQDLTLGVDEGISIDTAFAKYNLAKKIRDEIEAAKKALEEKQAELDKEYDKHCADNLNITALKTLQTKYPLVHIGGSAGLFLHGTKLDRFHTSGFHDLDVVAPYYTIYEGNDEIQVKENDAAASGNDFDQTFIVTVGGKSVKVDVKIDPKQSYEVIEYDGFKFKVSKLEAIWEAKMRYLNNKDGKHRADLYEINNKKQKG